MVLQRRPLEPGPPLPDLCAGRVPMPHQYHQSLYNDLQKRSLAALKVLPGNKLTEASGACGMQKRNKHLSKLTLPLLRAEMGL